MTLFHRCFSTILVVNILAWFLNKMSKCLKRVKTRLFQMCISFLRCFNNMSCLYRSLLIQFLTTKNDAGIPLSTTNASITERAKNNVIMKKQTNKKTHTKDVYATNYDFRSYKNKLWVSYKISIFLRRNTS